MRGTVYEEPLIGGVHELMEAEASLDDARQFVDAWSDDFSIRSVYALACLIFACKPLPAGLIKAWACLITLPAGLIEPSACSTGSAH